VRRLLSACNTPLIMLLIGITIYVVMRAYYSGSVFVYGPDSEDILAPLFFDISRSIHHYGLLAGMYNPGQVAGLSLWGTPYFHPLYPFYFNWLGSDASIFDTMDRLRIIDLLHLSIYGSGCYFLCREIGVRQWLSIVVGLCVPWLPAVHSMLYWPQILASFAWIPWVIACQLRLYKSPPFNIRILAIFGTAVTFSLLVYAQPAQNMVLAVVGAGLIWICTAVYSIRSDQPSEWQSFLQATRSLMIAGAVAALLCGAYLLNVVLYLSKAIRWLGDRGIAIGSQRMSIAALREYALHWNDITALTNYSQDHTVIIGNLYVGVPIALCAALVCAANRSNSKLVAPFISAAIALLFCFSIFVPVLRLIPIANKVRELNWWSCYVVTIVFPLGAYGLQWLLESQSGSTFAPASKRRPVLLCCIALGLVLLVALKSNAGKLTIEVPLLCLSMGALIACLAWPLHTRRFHQPMAAMIIIASTLIPILSYARLSPAVSQMALEDHIQTRQEAKRIAAIITDGDKFRFAVSTKFPNFKNFTVTLSNLDLRGVRGDISPQEYDKFRLLFFPSPAIADLYGVKYQIIPSQDSQTGDIAIDKAVSVHTNEHALPRLFFVQGGIKIVESPVDALLSTRDDNLWHFYVARNDLPSRLDFSAYTVGSCAVTVPNVSVNSPVDIQASLTSGGSGLLVLNEDPSGRWKATVDGKVVTPIRVNGFQTAFPVTSAGEHEFEIKRPTHLF
jgi:hypothetical protein